MDRFSIGQAVTVAEGPMKGLYGIVIYLYEDEQKYLVRFSGSAQMYYYENQIVEWT